MGGRGAASGMSNNGKPYGSEYRTLVQVDNIKFVERRDSGMSTTAPIETRSENRIYATISKDNGQMHSISIMRDGTVRTQIDYQDRYGLGPHTHEWTCPERKWSAASPVP
ncbi:hypothetical protein [Bifidobacterium aesculapii]|uniref:hypothetical protein n=1 Tax=Bifidobacterium aesculapii TaxID=1329411 RepID=UPI0006E36833|nr:hypothetical protein [Bifidobacterium aesculapii]